MREALSFSRVRDDVSVQCPCCRNDVGVDDHDGACPFRPLDEAEIAASVVAVFSVDGQSPSTLDEIINDNADVGDPLDDVEVANLLALPVGRSCFVGMAMLTRLADVPYPLNDDGDEVEHTERCFRCGLDVEIGAHEDGCPTEGQVDDSATARMIEGSGGARQILTLNPQMLCTARLFSVAGGAR